MIPRIVHQTFKAKEAIKSVDRLRMKTWEALNPTWTIMLWDDQACANFVQTEYPDMYPTYAGLSKNVERADFFRYLVVYHYGGLYADTDVTCLQPVDQWLPPSAELVVGLENEFPSAELAGARQYACARQYLQWAFLAKKGAPLLKAAVDRILHPDIGLPAEDSKARKADLTTLELTGPGMWTQEIFKYVGGLVDEGQNLDAVLLLPRVSMGLFPKNFQGIDTDHPGASCCTTSRALGRRSPGTSHGTSSAGLMPRRFYPSPKYWRRRPPGRGCPWQCMSGTGCG